MISTTTPMETNERVFATLKISTYIQEISIPNRLLPRDLHFRSFTRIDSGPEGIMGVLKQIERRDCCLSSMADVWETIGQLINPS